MENENEKTDINNQSEESSSSVVMPKEDWIEKAIEYEATPKRLRYPEKKMEFMRELGVPSTTYYRAISRPENLNKIIDTCFKQAKYRTAEIIDKMGQKAEMGNDVSIAQFMEYVLEIKKRFDFTTGGEKITPIYGNLSKCNCDEKSLPVAEEDTRD